MMSLSLMLHLRDEEGSLIVKTVRLVDEWISAVDEGRNMVAERRESQ